MKHGRMKVIAILLVVFGIVVAGCSSGKDPISSTQPDGQSTNSPSAKPTEERVKLSMFMANSGLEYPKDVDPNNNEFINIVKDYANVDLQMTIPPNADFTTKLNLMLSSGNIPDIVHTSAVDPVNVAAEAGAFLDLKKYYDNSPIMQRWITPTMMEMAKYKDNYYRIPMAWDQAPQGGGNYVRVDLLEKYNGGAYPDTIEGYVEVLRKIKQANPDSIPLTSFQSGGKIFQGGYSFFQWYGARPNDFRVQDGKILSTFILPEYRAAVTLFKELYKEGILDREFATNDYAKWSANTSKDTLLVTDSADQILPLAAARKISKGTANDMSHMAKIAYTPALKTYPPEVKDPKYTYMKKGSPIIFHGVYISSKTKNPDRAWKVLEGFASEELNKAIFWGNEGSEYVVKDGKKIPDAEKLLDPQRYWSLQLSIIPGFLAGQESKFAQQEQALGEDYKLIADSLKIVADQAEEAGVGLFSLMPSLDEVSLKLPESDLFISGATVDAITGNISMEEFDNKVAEYIKKYGFIADAYTKYMNENKSDLASWEVKEINW